MAKVFHRMFHRDRKCGFNTDWKPPEFFPKQIRLLVFQESDTKGKKLLFDSKSIKKTEETPQARKSEGCSLRSHFYTPTPKGRCTTQLPRNSSNPCLDNGENGKYQFQRPGSDVKLLGEMMFGSVAISYRGSTLKVHTLRHPPQLMLTRIFILKPVKDSQLDTDSIEHDNASLNSSLLDLSTPKHIDSAATKQSSEVAHSLPMMIPNSPSRSKDTESGVTGMSGSSSSFFTPFPSPCSSVSSTSSNSFSRRLLRSQTMRMDIDLGRRRSSIDSASTTQDEPVSRKRNPKIGLAIVIGLGKEERDEEQVNNFESFFFSHFSLFESHFKKLTLAVEKALTIQRKTYLTPLLEALDVFRNSICNLYLAPRIQKPIWLDLMNYPSQRGHLCHHFLKELMLELDQHNTANNCFFVSCLLTAVLTHHLAWVPTVMPAGVTPNRAYLDKHSSTFLDTLAKSHPYNPLLAQLGDLYGSIGYPVNIAKTIIVGKKAEVVCRLLFILSYFIRCSEVYEKQEKREEIIMEYKPVFNFDDVAEFVLMPSDPESTEVKVTNQELKNHAENGNEVLVTNAVQENSLKDGSAKMEDENERTNGSGYISRTESNEFDKINKYDTCSLKTKKRDSGIASSIEHSLDNFESQDNFEVQWEKSNSNAKLNFIKQERRFVLGSGDDTSSSDDSRHASPIANRRQNEMPSNNQSMSMAEICVTNNEPNCMDLVCTQSDTPLQVKCENVVAVGRAPERTKASNLHLSISGYVPPPNSLSKSTIPGMSCDKLYPDLTNAIHCGDVNDIDILMVDHSETLIKPINGAAIYSSTDSKNQTCKSELTLENEHKENGSGNSTPTREQFNDSNNTPVTESPTTPKIHLYRSYSENCGYDPRLVKRGTSVMSDFSNLSKQSIISSGSYDMDPEELAFYPSASVGGASQCSHLENFGRSLLGSYSPRYLPDFALQGLPDLDKTMLRNEMKLSTQNSVLDEPIAGSVCIIADTDKWMVELLSSDTAMENRVPAVVPQSKLVSNLLQSIRELWQMKLAPDFCLMHLEDRLQEIYFKSTLLTDYLKSNCKAGIEELQSRLAIDQSDIPLLLSVSGVHSSQVVYKHLYKSLNSNYQQQSETLST